MWARRGVPLREQLYAGRGELWAPDRCPGCRPSASRPWPDMVQGLGRLGRKRDPAERLRPAATSVTNRQRDQQLSALSVNASGQLQPLPPACAAARHSYAAGEGEAGEMDVTPLREPKACMHTHAGHGVVCERGVTYAGPMLGRHLGIVCPIGDNIRTALGRQRRRPPNCISRQAVSCHVHPTRHI